MTKFWARIPVKVREQITRAGRLFAVTLIGSLATLQGKHIDAALVLSLIVGAAEVVFRQFVPVTPDSPPLAPAPSNVTIIPTQPLGLQPPTDGTA